jgi:hypothetical protein
VHGDAGQLRQRGLEASQIQIASARWSGSRGLDVVEVVVVEAVVERLEGRFTSAKSIIQPLSAPGSPDTCSSTAKEWPCRRAHLCPAGTFGRRCAASMRKTLKMSICAV